MLCESCHRLKQFSKAFASRDPMRRCAGLWIEAFAFRRRTNGLAQLSERFEFAKSSSLHEHICEHRCLDWSRDDCTFTCIRRESIQQGIARSAADDMNDLDAFTAEFLQLAHDE